MGQQQPVKRYMEASMSDSYVAKWQFVADDVISILIARYDAWIKAIEAGVVYEDLPAGPWREAYQKLMELRSSGAPVKRPLVDTELATICGPNITVQWVAQRAALYDEYRYGGYSESLEKIKDYGRTSRQLEIFERGILLQKAALNNGQASDALLDDIMSELQIERSPNKIKRVDIHDIGVEAEKAFEEDPRAGTHTGIPIFDTWTGGLADEEMIAWVGPTKQRKTSAAANAILSFAKQGKQVDIFSFDENRTRFYFRLMSMLMAEYLWNTGQWEITNAQGTNLNTISRKILMQAGNRWQTWPEALRLARLYAKDTLLSWRGQVRIYDTQTIEKTPQAVASMMKMDAARYGRLDAAFVDHIQTFDGFTGAYETVQESSKILHGVKSLLGCIMWILSQQNEAAIRGGDAGSWSPNVKGGGGLNEQADTIVVSNYLQGTVTDPKYLRINLRQGRDDASGVWGYCEIHPPSGWITPRYVDVNTLIVDPETWEVRVND
jgi:replicative DNA helicase